MPKSIWRGTISFGLVTIPVSLVPALSARDLSFHLLDGQTMSPVHNKRVNDAGEEIEWDRIVKGYELPDGRWVTVTDDELKAANVAATQTIDVLGAVCADQVSLRYFSTPYHLAPDKPGMKPYALLRDALRDAGRIAIGQVVIRTRQHLCALIPEGDLLLLQLLHYENELRSAEEITVPGSDLDALGVSEAEVALARQLVTTIETEWRPELYHDSYRADVLALIERKAEGEAIEIVAAPEAPTATVVDIAELLKRSVEEARRARAAGGS